VEGRDSDKKTVLFLKEKRLNPDYECCPIRAKEEMLEIEIYSPNGVELALTAFERGHGGGKRGGVTEKKGFARGQTKN